MIALPANHALAGPGSEAEVAHDAYLRAAIVEDIGPDAFILRLNRELQRPGILDEHLSFCLITAHDLQRLPEVLPHIQKHGVMDVMVKTMNSHCTTGNPQFRLVVYSHVSTFIW